MKRSNLFIISVTLLVTAITAAGCVEEFDDSTMAELKKPEILSVVLEPPEAAPGEPMRASFLIADQHGPIVGKANIWLPVSLEEGVDMQQALQDMDLTMDDLTEPVLELTAPPQASLSFNEDGFATAMLTVAAAVGNDPDPGMSAESLLSQMETFVNDGRMKSAMRTAVFSTREDRNENPSVISITSGTEDAQGATLEIAVHDAPDLPAVRQNAADNPLLVKQDTKIHFQVQVEDDGDPDETIRYQWIATGGDFEGYREQLQPWTSPEHKAIGEGEEDQTGMTGVDPRTDPNLHAVWVVLRDDNIPNQLGQAWAELYVRVTP